jgi:thiamine biosynthesis lipoprotein
MTSGARRPAGEPVSAQRGAAERSSSAGGEAGGRAERLTPRARALLPVFLALLLVLAVRQLWCSAPPRTELAGEAMGTRWFAVLGAAGRSRAEVARARAGIEAEIAAVERRMSTWDPDSELSRFNRHLSTDPFPLSPDTLAVLAIAREVSERSGGAFDVTVRPLVAAWGFGAGARAPGPGPGPDELAALRARVGYRRLELAPAAGAARKRHPELECDLSAVAKGWAVDRAAEALAGLGFRDYLLELGGEVRVGGERPGGGAWRVAIERPDSDARAAQTSVELRDAALATSGDYRSFYMVDGERRSHLLDPRSGRPVSHGLASVSVVHRRAALADAWATALAVLGPQEGFARAEAEGLGACFIERRAPGDFLVRTTSGFPPLRPAPQAAAAPAPTRDAPGARP